MTRAPTDHDDRERLRDEAAVAGEADTERQQRKIVAIASSGSAEDDVNR
jgi:hypothetical protein